MLQQRMRLVLYHINSETEAIRRSEASTEAMRNAMLAVHALHFMLTSGRSIHE